MPPKNGGANNLIVSIRILYLEQRDKSRAAARCAAAKATAPSQRSFRNQQQRQRQRRPPKKSRRPQPFDPALRDLRMNRPVGRFTKSKSKAHRQDCLCYQTRYSTQRLKSREALVPPKPKEFESA